MATGRTSIFFADTTDIHHLLICIEQENAYHFISMGSFEDKEIQKFNKISEVPGIGISNDGDDVSNHSFLVMNTGDEPYVRSVPQRKGGIRYIIDQQHNENSIIIRIGGRYKDAIIASSIGTIHSNSISLSIFKTFEKYVKKMKRTNQYFIGDAALKAFTNGVRLTRNYKSPIEYDVVIR